MNKLYKRISPYHVSGNLIQITLSIYIQLLRASSWSKTMSDIAPSVPMPVLKTEPGGNLTHVGDINNSLIGVSQLSSVVIGMSGNANSGGIMMPTIINDESISEPQSPISSGTFYHLSLSIRRHEFL